MRHDMSKVIVERPRRGSSSGAKKVHKQDWDTAVSHEGMRSPHRRNWSGKELNENLAPLYRFLHSRVGQVWDDVYSEICANIKVTSTVQEHIRVHVKDMVETKIWIDDDGEPWEMRNTPHKLSDSPYTKYWVDPRDGLLKINNAKTYKQKNQELWALRREEESAKTRSFADGTELRKSGGIWYQVTLEQVPLPATRTYTRLDGSTYTYEVPGRKYDVILEKTIETNHYNYGRPIYYCATKRQISSKELKRYGLTND